MESKSRVFVAFPGTYFDDTTDIVTGRSKHFCGTNSNFVCLGTDLKFHTTIAFGGKVHTGFLNRGALAEEAIKKAIEIVEQRDNPVRISALNGAQLHLEESN